MSIVESRVKPPAGLRQLKDYEVDLDRLIISDGYAKILDYLGLFTVRYRRH